jgi:SM-20-related protein
MIVAYKDFKPETFSFQNDPVLVLEGFWSPEDQKYFLDAMEKASWNSLMDMPNSARSFPNCGNWLKGRVEQKDRENFLGKIDLDCISDYIDSFPNITGRHLNLAYYSYGVGDSLSTHDDTAEDYLDSHDGPMHQRRLAMVSYFHEEWHPDWGGELIVYEKKESKEGKKALEICGCVAPKPRSLAMFTVPRFHRVCRIDPHAGNNRRKTIVTWFMTEHQR